MRFVSVQLFVSKCHVFTIFQVVNPKKQKKKKGYKNSGTVSATCVIKIHCTITKYCSTTLMTGFQAYQ